MGTRMLKKFLVLMGGALICTIAAGNANAQTTVTTTLTTDSSITAVDGADADYGTWFIAYRAPDAFDLVMDTAGVTSTANIVTSTALNLVLVDQPGDLTVDLPAGANGVVLDMERTAITDFADPALTLTSITYGTATEGANLAFAVTPATVPVTVVTGGTPEPVTFGSTIAVTGQPVDGADTADYDVTFSF